MTAVLIGGQGGLPAPPFGLLTNQSIAAFHRANQAITRLQTAVAAAASGYTGIDGTQYEGNGNNFGVVADPNNPGAQGKAYAYAVNLIAEKWATFWSEAGSAIETIDNGATLGGTGGF